MAKSTAEEVRQFYKLLHEAKNYASSDIQQSVHKNYAEFIRISKEMAKLESDLNSIHGCITEIQQISDAFFENNTSSQQGPNDLGGGGGGSGGDGSKGPLSPSSPMEGLLPAKERRSDGAADFKTLTDNIEGITKFIPDQQSASKVLADGGGLAQVHQEDPKQGKAVYFILLNDLLLLAYRKKKVGLAATSLSNQQQQQGLPGSKQKFVVERYFTLSELAVVNMNDSPPEIVNSFRVIHQSDSLVIRAESRETKQRWLDILTKSMTDSAASSVVGRKQQSQQQQSAENEKRHYNFPVDSLMLAFQDSQRNRQSVKYYRTVKQRSGGPKEDLSNPDLIWLKEMPDELDVFIAHREFDNAIRFAEKARGIVAKYGSGVGNKRSAESYMIVSLKKQLDDRVQRLSGMICKELASPALTQRKIHQNIERLLKLDLGEKARDIFLSTRTGIIQKRIHSLNFDGDTVQYINDLAFIVFTLIRNTCEWYRNWFREPLMSSGFIKWVKAELERYAAIFRCQVFHESQRFDVIRDCLNSTSEHCQMLVEVGLEMGFLFDLRIFRKDVAAAVELLRARQIGQVAKEVADDDFSELIETDDLQICLSNTAPQDNHTTPQTVIKGRVTKSAKCFVDTLVDYLFFELSPLLHPLASQIYYTEVVDSVVMFFEVYFRQLMDQSQDSALNDLQHFNIIFNLYYLSFSFFPFLLPIFEKSGFLHHQSADSHERECRLVGFHRIVPEWRKILRRCQAMTNIQISTYYSRRSKQLAKETYAFGKACIPPATSSNLIMDYSNDAYPVMDTLLPKDAIIRCVQSLAQLFTTADDASRQRRNNSLAVEPERQPIEGKSVLRGVLEQFMIDISSEENWVADQGYDRVFGYSGVQQFILDIHYLSKLCDPYLSETATKLATDSCSRALKIYFKRFTDPSRILKPGDWYDRRVAESLKKTDPLLRAFLKKHHQTGRSTGNNSDGSGQDLHKSTASVSAGESPAKSTPSTATSIITATTSKQ